MAQSIKSCAGVGCRLGSSQQMQPGAPDSVTVGLLLAGSLEAGHTVRQCGYYLQGPWKQGIQSDIKAVAAGPLEAGQPVPQQGCCLQGP